MSVSRKNPLTMPRLSKDKRDKLILVAIGTIAIVAGLWLGVVKTRNEQLKMSRTTFDKAKDKLEKAKRVVSQAAQAQADMEAATKKLGLIEETMASGDLYSWAYLLLEKARGGHDVNIIEVARPAKGEVGVLPQFPYQAAIFSVRGTGYYHEFGKFLADFENRFPYFHVQNLSLTGGSEASAGASSSVAQSGEEKLSFKMDIVSLIKPNQ
jgi:Tfp pilus assembly protein PilO